MQRRVKCLAQGHLDTWTRGSGPEPAIFRSEGNRSTSLRWPPCKEKWTEEACPVPMVLYLSFIKCVHLFTTPCLRRKQKLHWCFSQLDECDWKGVCGGGGAGEYKGVL